MASPQSCAELERAGLELIDCARQPGRLRISRHACALRYLLAQKAQPDYPNDEFGMAIKAGLDICKNCPDGRSRSKGMKNK
ncbi:MAG: hypothetical protein ACUVXD_14990 [Thermodesulfobacteriota bacterium]